MNDSFEADKLYNHTRQTLINWADALDKYNNGKMGVPNCK